MVWLEGGELQHNQIPGKSCNSQQHFPKKGRRLWCCTSLGGASVGEKAAVDYPFQWGNTWNAWRPLARCQKAHLKWITNPRLPYVVKPGFLGKTHQSDTAQLSNNNHLNSKSSLLQISLSGAGWEAVILITVLRQFLKGVYISDLLYCSQLSGFFSGHLKCSSS